MNPQEIKKTFESDLARGLDVEHLKTKFLGRKQGLVTLAFKNLVNIQDPTAKHALGQTLNSLKDEIEFRLAALEKQSAKQILKVDLTLPSEPRKHGHLHPQTQTQKLLEDIFRALGFSVEYGFEIENDWYNFTALNFPENHPARDMQDTFFLKHSKDKLLLRTHTSPMQVRFMEKHRPPFAIIVPGTCYRNEATDATHEHTFDQLEGLVVGEDINFANMVWVLQQAMKAYFGPEVKTKLLPAYFPFVEPGAEVAISTPKFQDGRWVELFGCGMVHQNVFKAAGYPKNKYQGFAFGLGTTRFTLMKYGISDIRLLRENDIKFLEQF